MMTRLLTGWAEEDFTPEPGLTLMGQMHERRGERMRDPLMASAMAVADSESTVVLVSVDICMLSTGFVRETQTEYARLSGLPAGHLLIHATHTHVAPTEITLLASTADPTFVERVRTAILQASFRALAGLQLSDVFAGAGHMDEMGWNRRGMFGDGSSAMYGGAGSPGFVGLEGPRDPTLGVVFSRDLEGHILGVVVNFSTHPNTLENECFYSADIPGEVRRVLKQLLGPEVVIAYLTGAAGNTAPSILDRPVPTQPWRGEEGLMRSGLYLGGEVARVIAASTEPMAEPVLRLASSTLSIPVRPWPAPEDPSYPRPLVDGSWASARSYYEAAMAGWGERLERESPVGVRVHSVRIGDAALCTSPAELFVEYGLKIREGSPARVTLVAELTDGYVGYVPTQLAFERGGYETWPAPSSQLVPEAGEEIAGAAKAMLGQLF